MLKITSCRPVDRTESVLLKAADWADLGSGTVFNQSVAVDGVVSGSNPEMYSVIEPTMSESDHKAYIKAYAIISQGCAITRDDTVVFYTWKKPETDVTVRLKGV